MKNEGWIEWSGGECPVPIDTRVQYRLRSYPKAAVLSAKAGGLRWDHGRTPESAADSLRNNDIIAYRIAEPLS